MSGGARDGVRGGGRPFRVLIAASGTGGHLFPALHIARAFRELQPDTIVEFIGSGRPLEEKLIDGNGYRRHVVATVGIKNRGLRGLLQFSLRLPKAFLGVWRLLSQFKPDVVVGVGGYTSFLPVTIGCMRGIPTWIHEAELKPGLANHVLAYYARKISVAFPQAVMPRRSRVVVTGHPVRKEVGEFMQQRHEPAEIRRVLITGGSQGAQGLDKGMLGLLDFVKARSLEIWHQTRKENVEQLSAAYSGKGIQAKVVPFIEDMVAAFRWADIIVSRSGASMTMELGVVNKPVIFVPFPYAQGDHQTANAKVMVDAGKALLVKEGDEFSARLKAALEMLLDKKNYVEIIDRPYAGRSIDAAKKIAEGCFALTERP